MVLVHKKSNALKKEKIHDCSPLAMSAHPEKEKCAILVLMDELQALKK